MVTGDIALTKELTSARGRRVRVAVVRPEENAENIRELRQVSARWFDQARSITDGRVQRRAFFAASVAFEAAQDLLGGHCCVAVAQDVESSEVLGIVTYRPDAGGWWIDNLTTAPENQPGGKGRDQVRGIGSTLLRVVAEQIGGDPACTSLRLQALDEEAEAFWERRGFHNRVGPLKMTCPEVRDLARELSTSHPDEPDAGDLAAACDMDRWRAVEVPAALGRMASA